jgi:two-component system, NarL family, response regulator
VTKSPKVRVLVADDHSVVRFGLSAIISQEPDMAVTGLAANGGEAVQLFEALSPDVSLMDLRMPGMGGVDAIRTIRKNHPISKFIVLTTYHGDEDIHRARAAGAEAYLLKGMRHDEIIDAIRRVHAGLQYWPASVIENLARRPPNSELRCRELEILKLVAKGQSNKEIAETLAITEGTVKWHVNIILSRLGVSDRTKAAISALQRGIVEL